MQETHMTERKTDGGIALASSRYIDRGLAEAARREVEAQSVQEERTQAEAPRAYRLSAGESCAEGYRSENGLMTEEGLLRYANESRAMRIANKDFAEDTVGIYAASEAHALEPAVKKPTALDAVRQAGERVRQLPATTADTVKKRYLLWFDPRRGSTENEKRRFPLSAFAAVAAVAISMMLIVAGSLMVIGAETQISRLNRQITDLREEVTDLRATLETSVDLVELRRIATEEYGMVGEEYLKMDLIVLDRDEIAEVKGEKKRDGIGLAGLLSAIGLK